jgi:two-component system NtrC family sensor kinase
MTAPPPPRISSFELIGTVARVLNSGLPPEDTLGQVATILHQSLAIRAAVIWRRDASAATFSCIASPPRLAAAVSLDEVPLPGGPVRRIPLVHGGVRLGLLDLELWPHGADPPAALLELLQHLLAPFLDAMTLAEDLALEVASRSREASEQRRFTALVIDSLPVGIYVIDRDYRIQFWNRKRETGTQGLRRAEVLGRPVFEVLTRQPAEQLRSDFDRVFATGQVSQRDTVVDVNGSRRIYRLSRIPMRLEGEAITHVVTVGEDVTDSQDAQHNLLQREKLAAVGQLAAGVMHEINNPLATIAACAAAIDVRLEAEREGSGGPIREYLDIIDKEVQRCTKIVDGLLEFSRAEVYVRAKAPVEINVLMERTLFLLKHHKRFKRLAVTTALAPSLPSVLGNEEQLIQVFMALLLNAVDAMRDHGAVTVATRFLASQREVVVEIEDTGHGIAASELAKIFEPFYTTKPPGQGTGLGLSIAYGIVQEHGGRIEAESEVGTGSVFRVVLPVAVPERP